MSSIQNRITTTFVANAGNVSAVMGGISGEMRGLNGSINQTNRNSEALSGRLRAIGTTMRYAFAGSVVFGVANLVRNLSDLQTQFALLTSINPDVNAMGSNFTTFFDELQKGAVDSLTPVNELASAAVNLVSSLDVQKSQITGITTTLAEGAQLAQAPVEELTKGITGMIQAFGEAPTQRNIEAMTRGFITVTRRAPGGIAAGQQIIQQLGPSALSARLGHISPQQLFGLITTVLRAGGSPATGMRGLNFLLQSISTPNKAEAKVLAGIGITPDFVQQQGGLAAIFKLVDAMKRRGVTGNISRTSPFMVAGDDTLDNLDSMGMQGMKGLGVGGQGLQLAQRAIGRIHGVRALVAILQQLQTGKLPADIEASNRAITGMGREGEAVSDQFKRFRQQQPLRAAAIALTTMANEAPKALEGILDPIARKLDVVGQLAIDHPKGTRRFLQVGAGIAGLLALGRFTGFLKPGMGGIRGLLGKVTGGQMFVQERAAEAALNPANAGIRGASPQNPLYVTVVGQLFGGGGSTMNIPGGRGGSVAKEAENVAKDVGGGAGLFGIARRLLGSPIARAIGITGGAIGAGLFGMSKDQGKPTKGLYEELARKLNRSDPQRLLIEQYLAGHVGRRGLNVQMKTAEEQKNRLEQLNRTLAPFHRRDPLYGVTAIYSEKERMVHGKAEIVLDVNMSTDKGPVRKKIHVPMALWTNGRTPSQRGQGGKTKANIP